MSTVVSPATGPVPEPASATPPTTPATPLTAAPNTTNFQLQFDGETKPVEGCELTKETVLQRFDSLFPDPDKTRLCRTTFYTKDQQFNVMCAVDDFGADIYEGAVVEARIKANDEGKQVTRKFETFETFDQQQGTMKKQKVVECLAVKIRGLPYSATNSDVQQFFRGLQITEIWANPSFFGKQAGEAFVEFPDADSVALARQMHKKPLGRRYIEVFAVEPDELSVARSAQMRIKPQDARGDLEEDGHHFLRLKGLPFQVTQEHIYQFFQGLRIEERGIHFIEQADGRMTGDGFVQFETTEDAKRGKEMHRGMIGKRFIEVYVSTKEMFEEAVRKANPITYQNTDRKSVV